jgi:hypothetical protein
VYLYPLLYVLDDLKLWVWCALKTIDAFSFYWC